MPRSGVIGLLPAAGQARRISPLPCSKELLPVWSAPGDERPRPVCEHALRAMRRGGIERAFIVLRPGKWDIPAHVGNGPPGGPSVGYLLAHLPHGVPYTLDAAFPFVQDHRVALAFPDILFDAEDAFARILEKQERDGGDVVLGLFPAERSHTMDMVELQGDRVRRILIKPARTALRRSWAIAVWSPAFTRFLHGYLTRRPADHVVAREFHLGDVFQAAIDAGLRVEGQSVADTPYLDIGNPEGLRRAYLRVAARFGADPARTGDAANAGSRASPARSEPKE